MRSTFSIILGLLLSLGAPLSAAPRPDEKGSGPAIVGQSRSWNDLISLAKASVKSLGGEKLLVEFEKATLGEISPAVMPSINPSKPFALYGLADADLTKCRLVILVPVNKEDDFIKQIASLGVTAEKSAEEGIYNLSTGPETPISINLKFHESYAYVSIGGPEPLGAKSILSVKDLVNPKETAAAIITVKVDRIPSELKKFAIANLNDALEQAKQALGDENSPGKEALNLLQSLSVRWLRIFSEQAKELTIKVDLNPKTAEMIWDVSLEALPKTPLAAGIARRPVHTNAFGGLINKEAVQWMMFSAPLFHEDLQDTILKLVELGEKSALKESAADNTPETTAFVAAIFKSLKATLKTGEMDLGGVLRGPNKDGFYTGIAALQCRETAQLEKAVKAALKDAPAAFQQMVKFDTGKIGDLNLHEIRISDAPEEITKLFGKDQTAYIAVGEKAIYFAYGADAKKALQEAKDIKPAPTAIVDSSGSSKKTIEFMKRTPFLQIFGDDDAGNAPKALVEILKTMEKNDQVIGSKWEASGGDKLHLKFTAHATSVVGGSPIAWFGMVRGGGMAAPKPAIKQKAN